MPSALRDPFPAAPAGESDGRAWFRGWHAARPVRHVDLREEPDALADGGWWAVVGEFEGPVHAWRFTDVRRGGDEARAALPPWRGPVQGQWASSLDRDEYCEAVAAVRRSIREGDVYQANICRVLQAPLGGHDAGEPDARALSRVLATGNPAPYAGGIQVPATDANLAAGLPPVWVVTASPELSLAVHEGRVTSRPIKGTGSVPGDLTAKDAAENLMITDLVRNDLQRVCLPGTVEVTDLLAVEEHPGLVHLVSTVRGRLIATDPVEAWRGLFDAALPAGSVSGAPKSSALRLIRALEPVPRGPYCGAVGWIDADSGEAELAVGIRTFWWREGILRFGTGAGIPWGSDPAAEWAETELKARHLVALASREIVGA